MTQLARKFVFRVKDSWTKQVEAMNDELSCKNSLMILKIFFQPLFAFILKPL